MNNSYNQTTSLSFCSWVFIPIIKLVISLNAAAVMRRDLKFASRFFCVSSEQQNVVEPDEPESELTKEPDPRSDQKTGLRGWNNICSLEV